MLRPDTLDFRDRMYEATLYEGPTSKAARCSTSLETIRTAVNLRMFAFIRLANVLLSSFAHCPCAHSVRGLDSLFCRIADFCLS